MIFEYSVEGESKQIEEERGEVFESLLNQISKYNRNYLFLKKKEGIHEVNA